MLGLYDHTVREFDSLVLLKMFLNGMNANYKYKIADVTYSRRRCILNYLPDLVLMPFFQSKRDLDLIPYKRIYNVEPIIINMHWEQIGSINAQEFFLPRDSVAQNVFHVSWSKDFAEFLIDNGGVDSNSILQVGNPRADFLSTLFHESYINRNELHEILNIPQGSNYILFIMGFSNAFMHKNNLSEIINKGGYKNIEDVIELTKISLNKCMAIIRSISKYYAGKNTYIVLRPHPLTPIQEISKEVSDIQNVRVSRLFPIHEIIYHSQGVISWTSTATLDAYLFNKPVAVIRPIDLPVEFDIPLLNGFYKVNNECDLIDRLNSTQYKDVSVLDNYKYLLYGSLNGLNTFNLAKKIEGISQMINLDENININYRHWFNECFAMIFKDTIKTYIAKHYPVMLPHHLMGRLDDLFDSKNELFAMDKYRNVMLKLLNGQPS